MKILLVEDEPTNIESAKMQLKDHELTIVSSFVELMDIHDFKVFDFILTDLYIKFGKRKEGVYYSVEKRYMKNEIDPYGIFVAIKAVNYKIPCVMVTDANGHHDAIGCLMENWGVESINIQNEILFTTFTRPCWVETPVGKGKDWLNAISSSPWKKLFPNEITDN